MRSRLLRVVACALAAAASLAHAAVPPPAGTAAEVISRNVAARGGLEAWRKVTTMVWLGHLERATAQKDLRVPFVMQLQRPNLTRFELKEQFQQFTRIFDGQHGWRVRPGSDGLPETKAFSAGEVAFAQEEYVIDGPLIDYVAKGVSADLDGIDTVEGRKAYRLSVRLPGGAERKIWIDVKTNLDIRLDRPATTLLAPGKPVSVYYADYRRENGLQIAHSIETRANAGRAVSDAADKLIIERVLVNPKLDTIAFSPPARPLRRGSGAVVRIPGDTPGAGLP
jgi:hypothetical protein